MVSVDGVDFRIKEPSPYEKEWSKRWYSSKFNGPGLRYEIAVSIAGGDIVWINGPFAPGQFPDYKIFLECGLKDMLETGDRVEADDGYMNADPQYIKAKSSAWHPDKSNSVRNRVRARHETVNNRMKFFNALGNKFQHPLQRHQDVFTAVAVLVQLSIRSGEELFEIDGYNQSLWV